MFAYNYSHVYRVHMSMMSKVGSYRITGYKNQRLCNDRNSHILTVYSASSLQCKLLSSHSDDTRFCYCTLHLKSKHWILMASRYYFHSTYILIYIFFSKSCSEKKLVKLYNPFLQSKRFINKIHYFLDYILYFSLTI